MQKWSRNDLMRWARQNAMRAASPLREAEASEACTHLPAFRRSLTPSSRRHQ
jgi:hypothetical protein